MASDFARMAFPNESPAYREARNALLDAEMDCQGVASSVRLPDQDGKPLWRVNCTNNTAHMIAITPDGTANIVSRTDR